MNTYLQEIHNNLPRLLASIDSDASSPTYGVADRKYTAWRTIDFANATNQGTAHGLARLIKNKQLPDFITTLDAQKRIDQLFIGAKTITRNNGSLEEAFPYEGSYCVTALVAFDLLSAIELLGLSEKVSIIEPLMQFISKQKETHAFISNHLATAAAAHIKWGLLINDENYLHKGDELLNVIYSNQSEEGWYLEYTGADPGYQSLSLY